MKRLLALLFLLIPLPARADPVEARVTSIEDGDTLTVNARGYDATIRLACIDAPESGQAGGAEATRRLQQLAPVGSAVTVVPVAQDRYGRVVGVLFNGDGNVNVRLVGEGHAIVYRRYLGNCPGSQQELLRAEAMAKSMAVGFWGAANCPPEAFRHGNCDAQTQPARSQCDPSYPTICIPPHSPDLNCPDVPHRNFPVRGRDPHGFDGDGDGVGCEG